MENTPLAQGYQQGEDMERGPRTREKVSHRVAHSTAHGLQQASESDPFCKGFGGNLEKDSFLLYIPLCYRICLTQ